MEWKDGRLTQQGARERAGTASFYRRDARPFRVLLASCVRSAGRQQTGGECKSVFGKRLLGFTSCPRGRPPQPGAALLCNRGTGTPLPLANKLLEGSEKSCAALGWSTMGADGATSSGGGGAHTGGDPAHKSRCAPPLSVPIFTGQSVMSNK